MHASMILVFWCKERAPSLAHLLCHVPLVFIALASAPSCGRKRHLFGPVILHFASGVSKGVHYIAFFLWQSPFLHFLAFP
jgi:hypothetical protein